MDEEKSSIKISEFTGKKADWPVWSEKFLARARRKGYKDVLTGKVKIPSDSESIDETTDDGKAKKKARLMNELAYEALVLLIDGETDVGRVAFAIVRGCKTSDLKDGDSNMAWKRLLDKYEPKSAPTRLMLKTEFNSMRLELNQDPDVWLTSLEDKRLQLINAGSMLSDEDLMEHALNNVPPEYEVPVSKLEDRLGSTTDPLTIESIREQFNLRFMRLQNEGKVTSGGGGGGNETAFFAGGFKGKCNHCGKWGHKAAKCPDKARNQNGGSGSGGGGGFKFKCYYCHKTGHKASECLKKRADKAARNDQAQMASEGGNNELAFLAAVDQPEIALVGSDDNKESIFIADSGASTHMVSSDKGMFDWKLVTEMITIGNGSEIRVKKVGKLRATAKQENGKEVIVLLNNVKYVPDLAPYNLFSITQALEKGFALGNKGTSLTLTKGSTVIEFDKKITTKSGWIGGLVMEPIVDVRRNVPNLDKGKALSENTAHEIFGHVGKEVTKNTAVYYGLTTTGKFSTCEECALAKARQKNVGGGSAEKRSKIPGERLFFDISSVKDESIGGSKFWLLVVDDCSDMTWSYFLETKK